MKCCLWLNRKKAYNIDDLLENYDPVALRSYLLGGCLCRWLRANNCAEIADKLDKIDIKNNIEDQLAVAFGISKPKPVFYTESKYFNMKTAYKTCFSSFSLGSLTKTNFKSGSFAGSFKLHEWEFEHQKGSFGSFFSSSISSFYFSKNKIIICNNVDVLDSFGYGIHII